MLQRFHVNFIASFPEYLIYLLQQRYQYNIELVQQDLLYDTAPIAYYILPAKILIQNPKMIEILFNNKCVGFAIYSNIYL